MKTMTNKALKSKISNHVFLSCVMLITYAVLFFFAGSAKSASYKSIEDTSVSIKPDESLVLKGASEPNVINAVKITRPLDLNGRMDDDIWKQAPAISNFTQRELNEGVPATERTEVRIVYDDESLYVGVWCYDNNPKGIIANQMKRDFDIHLDDNFEIILDTYHDKRNGYLFVINPNGARYDALVTDEGQTVNSDWNGLWDVRTTITQHGWFAEIEIPFSTLQFSKSTKQVWGINFERNIRRKREQDLWQAYLRNYGLMKLSKEGTLVGLEDIHRRNSVWVRPYLLSGVGYGYPPFSNTRTTLTKAGLGLRYAMTSALTLELTANTDFAEVEADQRQVNLTRFPLFFPEKRQFFLEDAGVFNTQFGQHSVIPFYSRKIGLNDSGQVIPVLGGARLVGKAGPYDVGFLSLETAASSGEPLTNYSVARVKKDLLNQSYVGFIATSKQSAFSYNRLIGFDGEYVRSDIFGTNTVVVGGALAGTTDPGITKNNLAYTLYVDYPNDFIEQSIGVRGVQSNFDPQVGFLNRSDFVEYSERFLVRPRPKGIGMQYIEFKPIDINYFVGPNGALQSLLNETRVFGFQTNSGEYFECNFQRFADAPQDSIDFYGYQVVPSMYWWSRWEMQFETSNSRPLSFFSLYSWGGFYNGRRQEIIFAPGINLGGHFSLSAEYRWNHIELASGSFVANEYVSTLYYGFSPTLNLSLLSQWNNEDNAVYVNFRVHWIPNIYSNVYFVVNQSFSANRRITPRETSVAAKIDYIFAL